MTMGSVADAAGVKVPTVRYYERRGMIAEPPRSPAGYRQYDGALVDRIRFIKRAQRLGFTLDEIDELLALRVDRPASCPAVEDATLAKLRSVEAKIGELERLRSALARLVQACRRRAMTEDCPALSMLEEEDPL